MSSDAAARPSGADDEAGVRLAVAERLYRLATQVVRTAPRDVSLNSLATLGRLEITGPRRVSDLAALEGVAQPSMTELVGRLVRDGLAERRPSLDDRRVVLVAITEQGRRFLRERRNLVVDLVANLLAQLTADEAAALAAAIPAFDHLHQLARFDSNP